MCQLIGCLPLFESGEILLIHKVTDRLRSLLSASIATTLHKNLQPNVEAAKHPKLSISILSPWQAWSPLSIPLVLVSQSGQGRAHISLPQQLVVDPESVNYQVIKGWLNTCGTDPNHGGSCSLASSDQPTSLRLIDIQKNTVVPAPQEARYVALSYVWGGTQSDEFPQVVLDSIKVASNLGFQYLWVDKYCIDQKSATNRHEQISSMHLVYGRAELTLIAAAGNDSTYGLPGANSRRRIPQQSGFFGDKMLVVHPNPRSSKLVRESHWNTRGWTYQEALLSRRRLFFTDYGVVLQCNRETFAEGIQWPPSDKPFNISISSSVSARDLPWEQQGDLHLPRHLQTQIESYSTKSLTYESDRLNAFLGILGDQEKHSPPIYHVWGVPVANWLGKWHMASLAWSTELLTRRHATFPTWSWAAWSSGSGINFRQAKDENPPIRVWLAKDDNRDPSEVISLDSFSMQHEQYRAYSTGTHYLKVEGYLGAVSLEMIHDEQFVVIQGHEREMMVYLDLNDYEFCAPKAPRQKRAAAFQVTKDTAPNDSSPEQSFFLVIIPQPDGSYQRIGSFRLFRATQAKRPPLSQYAAPRMFREQGELTQASSNPIEAVRESHVTVSHWESQLKKEEIWLS
ncbi:heterokaryon incompatibility protein-domain-containing protein [Cladorrhinum sp. PSN332]|nr:heterokaryon incompatibility protein-domain-containing protein [Cladorrhinum sp. PSN332]